MMPVGLTRAEEESAREMWSRGFSRAELVGPLLSMLDLERARVSSVVTLLKQHSCNPACDGLIEHALELLEAP